MSTTEVSTAQDAAAASAASTESGTGASVDSVRPRRRLVFWICRYLPAEVAGTAAMIVAGLAVTFWTESPIAIAVAALLGEIVGFYVVLAVTIYAEQAVHTASGPHHRRRTATRTALLLVAEFGPAELLDSLLIRPALLVLGVVLLPDPVWGLLAGKIVADVVFYAIAAGAFTITDRAGLRGDAPFARLRARVARRRSGVTT